MPYLRKLPSGRWRAEVEISGHRESQGGFLTKREAQEWATQIEADLRSGKFGRWPVKTVRQAVERYRDEVTPSKGSSKNETARLNAFLDHFPELADMRLTEVRPDHLQGWVRDRLSKPFAREKRKPVIAKPSTVVRESHTLSNVWTIAAKQWHWCPPESPWSHVNLPCDGEARDRRIKPTEVRKILRRFNYVADRLPRTKLEEVGFAFALALRTAMRSGELLGLTREDVDLETRVVRLRKHKTLRYTGRPRFVPVTKQAGKMLALLMADGRERLFTVSDDSRDALFRKVIDQMGIKDLRFHDTRGEALTALSKRVDVQTLQKISGHIDINVLLDHYYRETPAEIAKRLSPAMPERPKAATGETSEKSSPPA